MKPMVATMNRDIARLDTRLLLAFEALMAERAVTRAADRMGLTQQGMSGQLARMRDLFGDPLFVRVANGVAPTPRAEALAPLVREALSALRSVVRTDAFEPAAYEGPATIAASDYAQALILPPLLRLISTEAPRLRMVIRPVDAATLASDLRNNRIDLALTVPQFTPPGLRTSRLFAERYVGVARAGHHLLTETPVSLEAFCSTPHLLVAPFRGDATGPTDTALNRIGASRTIGLVVPGFSVAGALIEQSDLIAVLPERLIRAMRRDLEIFAPPVPIEGFNLEAVWPERLDASAAQRWLRDAVARAAASTCSGADR